MPCSFCRSHEHNIRYCNSPEVHQIVSRLARDAGRYTRSFDYSAFARIVHAMTHNELKIAALFWHTTIPSAEYENLLLEENAIPLIQCNYSREKYLHIVMWLYLDYAFSHCQPAILSAPQSGMYRVGNFIERLEYLHRIVIEGMNVRDSYQLYMDYVNGPSIGNGNNRSRTRFQSPPPTFNVAAALQIDFDEAAFGFTQVFGFIQVK